MRKIFILSTLLSISISLLSQIACGPTTIGNCVGTNSIQIGNGTTYNGTSYYPAVYGNWYKNTRHQILFLSSELLAAGVLPGNISSISFNVAIVSGTTTYPNFSIKMKCTNATDLSVNAMDSVGLSQVYFSATQNITTGWNTHNFQTAYEWDGTSNILIDVCNDFTAVYSTNSCILYTITPFVSIRWNNSDVTQACTTNNTNSFAPSNTYRPNVIFENCASTTLLYSKTKALNNVDIFPNPSSGLYTISNTINTNKLDIIITNTLGQTVMTESAKNTSQLSFDLSKMSKGIYYAKVTTDEGMQLFKLILE